MEDHTDDQNHGHEHENEQVFDETWIHAGQLEPSAVERRFWKLHGFDELPCFLAVEDAGKILGVARSTAYAWVSTNQLGSVLIGRCRRVPRSALFDFIVKHREEPVD